MKKKKVYISYILALILICCFSNVVFADIEMTGVVVKKTVVDNDGNDLVIENTTLKITGLNYDETTNTYYYTQDGEKYNFYGSINIPGKGTTSISLITNKEDNSTYVKLPEGITEDELKNSTLTLNNEDIQLSNIGIERVNVKEGDKDFWSTLWGVVTDTISTVTTLIESILNDIILPLGDGILYSFSKSVGEPVTIDGIIFNKVDKVNANFWESGSEGSVRNILGSVVNYWYNIFRKIAIAVYMITLVGVGVSIMLNSTAQKKAQYKEALLSWTVGVAILLLFPYVMKYILVLNNAVVGMMEANIKSTGVNVSSNNASDASTFASTSEKEAFSTFGKDEFVTLMIGSSHINNEDNTIDLSKVNDTMMKTRVLAQKYHKILLTVIYFILIGQTLVLLFAYYKRAFMIAFLITIFPLVAMSYTIDKLGDKKAQSFGIWFKEYVVNVIVQMFHAAVYVLVVNSSVQSFLNSNGSNWIFMILSVLFLFEGEKILRSIFNVKSSAGTLGDLAVTGATVMTVASRTAGIFGGRKNNNNLSESDQKHEREINERSMAKGRSAIEATTQPAHPESSGGSTRSQTAINDTDNETVPSDASSVSQSAKDAIAKRVFERKRKGNALSLSGAINFAANTTGTVIGATQGLATGKGAADVFNQAAKGKAIGTTLARPLSAAASKIDNIYTGHKLAKDISSGKYDSELDLEKEARLSTEELNMAEAEARRRADNGEDISVEEVISKYSTKKQEIMRQALAAFANRTSRSGEAKGRLELEEYIDKHRV